MSDLIVLNLGKGDWQTGWPTVIAQLWEGDRANPMQFTGSLPPAPELAHLYARWQQLYTALCANLSWRRSRTPQFELDEDDITHISQTELTDLSDQLQVQFNHWLNASTFLPIDRQLRTRLQPSNRLRIVIVAENALLLRFPWCLWNFLVDYPQAEIAISLPEYARALQVSQAKPTGKVRILAILGNSQGIDVARDRQLLQQIPQAEVKFLVEPAAPDLNQSLWQPGWDILFFAGHSSSQGKGQIQINQTESLTIEQLKYGLRTAIAHGLKLAIFNSCDGLGLARDLADLHLPQVIVMREPVPDRVAQEFLTQFLTSFAQGQPLYMAVRTAREKLQGLETEFPCASWLPTICQNPAEVPPTWQDWCGPPPVALRLPTRQELQTLVLSSLVVTGLVCGGRWLGWLQPLELWAFDHLMRLRPAELPDSRLLIITITDKDIQAQGNEPRRGSLSDRTLNRLLATLEPQKPIAIGLDLYRDYPTEEPITGQRDHRQNRPITGKQSPNKTSLGKDPPLRPQQGAPKSQVPERSLADRLRQSDRLIAICKRPDPKDNPIGIVPPPEVPEAQIGFSDFVQDRDGAMRRHLLFMTPHPTSQCATPYAFSVQLAMRYLNAKGIGPKFTANKSLQFGDRVLHRLSSRTGGYQPLDARGSQILLNYRAAPTPRAVAPQVTLSQVLSGQMNLNIIQNRIVLIGVDEPLGGDIWSTPYGNEFSSRLPGIMIHAQMVSQILSAVLDNRPLLWVWGLPYEILWIEGWAVVGGILAYQYRRLWGWATAIGITSVSLSGICLMVLLQGGWVPLIPTLIALVITSTTVTLIYRHA
jgi:CHASE2 domain-containing sensor protein